MKGGECVGWEGRGQEKERRRVGGCLSAIPHCSPRFPLFGQRVPWSSVATTIRRRDKNPTKAVARMARMLVMWIEDQRLLSKAKRSSEVSPGSSAGEELSLFVVRG